jgi:preprotein translocase subunit Sec61beta
MALTRRVIERQLDALTPHVALMWQQPWAVVAVGLTVGLVLSRIPLLRLVGTGTRVVQAGIAIAGTAAAIDRFLSPRRQRPAA